MQFYRSIGQFHNCSRPLFNFSMLSPFAATYSSSLQWPGSYIRCVEGLACCSLIIHCKTKRDGCRSSAAKRRHETRRVETTAGHLRSPRLKRNRYSINNWSRVGDWRALFPTREFCNDKTPTPYHAPTPQTNFILIAYVSLYCLPVFLI